MRFNHGFALVVWGTIVSLIALQGAHIISLPQIIDGFLISMGTLVVQFYFRKKPVKEEKTPSPQGGSK